MSSQEGKGLLKPIHNEQGFLKCNLYGLQGSGKTFTAVEFACGLVERYKLSKPIGFFDTEGGASFVAETVKKRTGMDMIGVRSRSFKTLLEATAEAEETCSVWIVDSATHVWRDLCDGYLARVKRSRLRIDDWMPLKKEWARFTTLVLNTNMHFVVCGRAGVDFKDIIEEDGSTKSAAVGMKMKAEGEFGFEPSLVFYMERAQNQKGRGTIHRAICEKDRFDEMDGAVIDDPKFADIEPHMARLAGKHTGVSTDSNSAELFDDNGDGSWAREKRAREIYQEKIKAVLIKAGLDGQSAGAKKDRLSALENAFNVTNITWTEIENMESGMIQVGYEGLAKALGQVPERVVGDGGAPEEEKPAA